MINIAKNIAVLIFFILLIVLIGLWEIRKYNRDEFKLRKEGKFQPSEELLMIDKDLPEKIDDNEGLNDDQKDST